MSDVIEVLRPSPHVAEIWLNRPDVRNAFNDAVVAGLTRVFAQLAGEPELRVVLLAARGKAFCAGADLNWMRAMADYSWDENRQDAQRLADMLWTLDQCPVPVVGRIQGDCYAGGMGLAGVCDVLVASSTATFCLSEARLGLLPATISPYVVRALGVQASRRYFVTAERFTAEQAHSLGLVHEVCEPQALDATVARIMDTLVANGPAAVKACKQLVRDVAAQPITETLRAETARRIADLRASPEGREGVQAFLNKRSPNWLV
jgi:methylglutaconyl-CoA hydratase